MSQNHTKPKFHLNENTQLCVCNMIFNINQGLLWMEFPAMEWYFPPQF